MGNRVGSNPTVGIGYRSRLPLMTAVAPFVYIGARGGRDERETGRYEL